MPERAVPQCDRGWADDTGLSRIVDRLHGTDLRPSPLVNALFRELVDIAVALHPDRHVLRCPSLSTRVQGLCATGEGHLESHWARRVVARPGALTDFPYLDNYRLLVEGELAALVANLGRTPRRLAFAGSGPLPLTAMLLERLLPATEIYCLDDDPQALARGAAVVHAVSDGSSRLRFVCSDATDFDYSVCDVALIGALVGRDEAAKAAVLTGVARSLGPRALLAVRSVPPDGRRLLYPRVESDHLPPGLTVCQEWTPPRGVINSLLLIRMRTRDMTSSARPRG